MSFNNKDSCKLRVFVISSCLFHSLAETKEALFLLIDVAETYIALPDQRTVLKKNNFLASSK